MLMVSKSCMRMARPDRFARRSHQTFGLSIENLRQIKPFKFYASLKPEIYPHLIRQATIAKFNRNGAERFNEAFPVKIDGV